MQNFPKSSNEVLREGKPKTFHRRNFCLNPSVDRDTRGSEVICSYLAGTGIVVALELSVQI